MYLSINMFSHEMLLLLNDKRKYFGDGRNGIKQKNMRFYIGKMVIHTSEEKEGKETLQKHFGLYVQVVSGQNLSISSQRT